METDLASILPELVLAIGGMVLLILPGLRSSRLLGLLTLALLFAAVDLKLFWLIPPSPTLNFFHQGTGLIWRHCVWLYLISLHETFKNFLGRIVVLYVIHAPSMTDDMQRASSGILEYLPRLGTKRQIAIKALRHIMMAFGLCST